MRKDEYFTITKVYPLNHYYQYIMNASASSSTDISVSPPVMESKLGNNIPKGGKPIATTPPEDSVTGPEKEEEKDAVNSLTSLMSAVNITEVTATTTTTASSTKESIVVTGTPSATNTIHVPCASVVSEASSKIVSASGAGTSSNSSASASSATIDTYTAEILKIRFDSHKAYVTETKALILKLGNVPIRLPNMPEDISENIAKFIIHYWVGDRTSKWTKGIIKKGGTKIPGDLTSSVEKAQEVKCFTSDGPPTFGPTEHWDVIYFLDARRWLDDHFVLWRVPLSNSSKEWRAVKVNSKETFDDHCKQGRRPRITWEGIYPQIKDHCSKVFDGTFAQIFTAKE